MKAIDPFQVLTPEAERMMDARKRGYLNELKVVYAVQTLKPWWFKECRWSDEVEDQKGIDLWILHKVTGWIPIQVKSSKAGLFCHLKQSERSEKKGRDRIACIISNSSKTLSNIIEQLEKASRFERMHGFFSRRRKAFKKLRR